MSEQSVASIIARRQILGLLATTGAAAWGSSAIPQPIVKSAPEVGSKFLADGTVRRFAGNTVICHLPQQGDGSKCFDALLDVYRQVPAFAFSHKITMLPPSSYHMTVCGGANDEGRDAGSWPVDIPHDLSMAECDRILADRLRGVSLGLALPIRMKVDTSTLAAAEHPLKLRLLPYDAEQAAQLVRTRDLLSQVLRLRAAEATNYVFHISLAYTILQLSAAEQSVFRAALAKWAVDIAEACPVIELGAPEFCTFDDMFAYHRRFYLY